MRKRIRRNWMRLVLFFGLVWRDTTGWASPEYIRSRLSWRTAWEVSCIVWD